MTKNKFSESKGSTSSTEDLEELQFTDITPNLLKLAAEQKEYNEIELIGHLIKDFSNRMPSITKKKLEKSKIENFDIDQIAHIVKSISNTYINFANQIINIGKEIKKRNSPKKIFKKELPN